MNWDNLNYILTTLPIGGIIGFFVKVLWDKYTNRPKVDFLERDFKINRIEVVQDGGGGFHNISVPLYRADYLTTDIEIVVTNSGNSNTAFSNILLDVYQIPMDRTYRDSKFKILVDGEQNQRAFNLQANSCKTIRITNSYRRNDSFEYLFEDEDNLSFTLAFIDVKGKEYKLYLDTYGVWTTVDED